MSNNDFSNVAEVQVTYRPIKRTEKFILKSSKSVSDMLHKTWDKDKIEYIEEFKIVLLNNSLEIQGIKTISAGGTNTCIADVKVIFQTALKCNASSIILAHNHPSGTLKHLRQI